MMNTVLFDLDGTLLPLDQDIFIETYFKMLAGTMAQKGFDPKQVVKGVMYGTGAMLKNDGGATNCDRFWAAFSEFFGQDMSGYEPDFDLFYRTAFHKVKEVTYPDARAAECIRRLKEKGYKVAVATSPVFPEIATRTRMEWAGLKWDDFELVTTYYNCLFCKPAAAYYEEILGKIGRRADECLMVGNDVGEDMCVLEMGMQAFWLDTWPLNRKNLPTEHLRRGGFDELLQLIDGLPAVEA
ncbi:MAG: HAD family hydrolase [Clostridia bacterium]|nr:HAD family hydrolase [Clostridia bacterium]